ncbi:MAG: glycerol kinase GlpK [Spirochaetes bacterium]|nr:glycerol kinase GlpK [Spirochaetota bacterium]
MDYFLALDAGTTSSRSILFDSKGDIVAIDQIEFNQIFPQKGWVEHNPEEIWETQLRTIKRVIQKANIKPEQIVSIGITNQRETTVLWDRDSGNPVYNAIVWQCRRTTPLCQKIKQENYDKIIFQKTGLVVDPYFSATKIKWIIDNVDKAKKLLKEKKLCFGTIDSWLLYKLTGGQSHKTDHSNASRTMLFNIETCKWDNELINYFELDPSILPEAIDSNSYFGKLDKSLIGVEIPITGILGDQQAALFGQTCFSECEAKMTYGTGGFILFNIGKEIYHSKNKLLTTIAWTINGDTFRALEGSIFIAGAAIQWLRDNLQIIPNSPSSELAANAVPDNGGIYFVPAFTGLGAPYWDPEAKGAIFGITRDTTKEHIVRAALEGIVFSTKDVVEAIEKDSNKKLISLKVDGGAAKNNFLLHFLADILNVEIIRPKITETTALGAALISALGCGYFKSFDELKKIYKVEKIFKPNMNEEKRNNLYYHWKKAIDKIRNF